MPQPKLVALTWFLLASRFEAEERPGFFASRIFVTGKDRMPHLHLFVHYLHIHFVRVDSGQVAHYPRSFVKLHQDYDIRAFTLTPLRRHENGGESLDFTLAAQFHYVQLGAGTFAADYFRWYGYVATLLALQ